VSKKNIKKREREKILTQRKEKISREKQRIELL